MSFAKNLGKNIGKNISKSLSSNYSQKPLDHTKQSGTDACKTSSRRVIQKTAEATRDIIGKELLIKLKYPQKLHHRII